ncbi:MAG: hypothetical protein H7202_07535 [Pedobacter sp.]|nr:hypothetical protein [Pedobacter sp.]
MIAAPYQAGFVYKTRLTAKGCNAIGRIIPSGNKGRPTPVIFRPTDNEKDGYL